MPDDQARARERWHSDIQDHAADALGGIRTLVRRDGNTAGVAGGTVEIDLGQHPRRSVVADARPDRTFDGAEREHDGVAVGNRRVRRFGRRRRNSNRRRSSRRRRGRTSAGRPQHFRLRRRRPRARPRRRRWMKKTILATTPARQPAGVSKKTYCFSTTRSSTAPTPSSVRTASMAADRGPAHAQITV